MCDADSANSDSKTPTSQAWGITKWLVPSVTALLIVIGYVAQLAHHSLVGFDPGLSEPNVYVAATANFIAWVLGLPLAGGAVWSNALFEGPHRFVVLPALVVGLGGPLWSLGKRAAKKAAKGRSHGDQRAGEGSKWLAFAALVALVILRFVTMDVPLAQLDGFLVPTRPVNATEAERADLSKRLSGDVEQGHWPRHVFAQRALTLWKAMVCSHAQSGPDPDASASNSGNQRLDCSSRVVSEGQSAVIAGEGLAHLLVALLIVLLAMRVVRAESSTFAVSIACLSILSCLALAVTFGKLGHSLLYEFSTLVISDAGAEKSTLPDQPRQGAFAIQTPSEGVVLQATSDWVTLARAERFSRCEFGVRIWRVSNDEIRWQRHIFRTDLLAWSVAKSGSDCAQIPGQPPATVVPPRGN